MSIFKTYCANTIVFVPGQKKYFAFTFQIGIFECVQNTATGKYKACNIRILNNVKDANGTSASYTYKAGGRRGKNGNNHNNRNKIGNNQYHSNHINTPMRFNNKNNAMNSNSNSNYRGNSPSLNHSNSTNESDTDRPKLGCFKLVKKDVTDRPMYIPVFL